MDEVRLVGGLIERAVFTADERRRIADTARRLVHAVRAARGRHGGIDAFVHEYGLTSEEGVILMCLAEALLRIPDADTADALIAEKIGGGQWDQHLGHSNSLFVNASTWGLMLTGRIVRLGAAKGSSPVSLVKRVVARSGEPVIRQALRQAMRIMGDQFVLGRTIKEALDRAAPLQEKGYRFSYDMLGEAAKSSADADRYFTATSKRSKPWAALPGPSPSHGDALMHRPGISVKLSAIHPRFDPGKEERLERELAPRLLQLCQLAESNGLTLDHGCGRAGSPRSDAWPVRPNAARSVARRLVRLGPCRASLRQACHSHAALAEAPVGSGPAPHSRAPRQGRLLGQRDQMGAGAWARRITPSLRARSTRTYPIWRPCASCCRSRKRSIRNSPRTTRTRSQRPISPAATRDFEFQRLHGMGESLYEDVSEAEDFGRPCRIYAPVGGHEDLLAYLVRRLLENGANTSFVNRLADEEAPVAEIVRDPVETAEREWQDGKLASEVHIPRPPDLYGRERRNSLGLPLTERSVREALLGDIAKALAPSFAAGPIVNGRAITGGPEAALVFCPHDRHQRIGTVRQSTPELIEEALASATAASHGWDRLGGPARAAILEKAADLMERDRARLMAVIVREAGKTLENAQGDLREAVDFLRYYAGEARRLFAGPVKLPGPTGERNSIELRGRGVFACISPWNFPIAIFTGQVVCRSRGRKCCDCQARRADANDSFPYRRRSCTKPAYPRTCCIC